MELRKNNFGIYNVSYNSYSLEFLSSTHYHDSPSLWINMKKKIIFACKIYHLLTQWQALSLALSSSFNSLRDSMRMMLLIPLYEWGNWASESLRKFSNYLRAYDRPILILNLCSWSLRALPNYLQSVIPWIKKHVSSKKLLDQKWKWSPEPNLWYLTDRCKHSVSGIHLLLRGKHWKLSTAIFGVYPWQYISNNLWLTSSKRKRTTLSLFQLYRKLIKTAQTWKIQ